MAIKRVLEAIEALRKGEIIVMIDDEDRENEGDLVYSSMFSTPEKINFLATHGKGLICVALSENDAKRLDLAPMVKSNTSSHETAFTVSVDASIASTGISASERDLTVKILANPLSRADELVRPGHIFPLVAKNGGTLIRTGHTEGSVDICRLAGLRENAVICEIMKDDGEMARREDLAIFSTKHNLKTIYISDVVEYRLQNERLVSVQNIDQINMFDVKVDRYKFTDHLNREHIAIRFYSQHATTNVRFHHVLPDVELLTDNEKFTTFERAINYLKNNGGIFIFLNSSNKHGDNVKEFGIGAQILKILGVNEIRLLSRKESKDLEFVGIHGFGLNVVESIIF